MACRIKDGEQNDHLTPVIDDIAHSGHDAPAGGNLTRFLSIQSGERCSLLPGQQPIEGICGVVRLHSGQRNRRDHRFSFAL